jgi:CTP synthase
MAKKIKFIVVTGGVYSGLGKGVVTASISALLAKKHKVVNIKWDGYHNHNPGTMNPIEHGECFVLDDGTEADLDFGHYERFTSIHATGKQSITRGKLNEMIAALEKDGKAYEGRTIEEIPHLRDLLLDYLEAVGIEQNADIITFEIGGNVGDDSANLALHAARMLKHRYGKEHVMYVHVAPMCYTIDDHEPKTRPIQRSLSELTSHGIEIDMLVVRTEAGRPLEKEQRRKISESSIISEDAIIEAPSLQTVYALPIEFVKQNVDDLIAESLRISVPGIGDEWTRRVKNILQPKETVRVALCGKYTGVKDSYKSVKEALTHAGATRGIGVELVMLSTEEPGFEQQLKEFDAIIVPGGYGTRGIDGKIKAIQLARESKVPYLGLCYGMQLAVVEFARDVCGLKDAHTTEVDPQTKSPVVTILPEQLNVTRRSGTQRLGAQEAKLRKESVVFELYDGSKAEERHRHRYEVNPEFHQLLADKGLIISGVHARNEHIAEFIELPKDVHPFFVGTQAHPELKSTLLRPAPLFQGLVDAAMERKKGSRK